jgi:plastocyanin
MAAGTTQWRQLVVEPIHPGSTTNRVDATTLSADPTTPDTAEVTSTVDPEAGVHYVSVRGDTGFTPSFHNVALGETVQWDIFGSTTDPAHDIMDAHGLGLIDSGPVVPVTYYRFTFTLSAEVRTMDDPVSYPDNHGKLVIPVQVSPTSGTTTDTYNVTWAIAPLNGFVEDVQIKRPGDTRWQEWQHGTSAEGISFVPDAGAGTYQFRDRVRKAGTKIHSRFGPPVPIFVSAT